MSLREYLHAEVNSFNIHKGSQIGMQPGLGKVDCYLRFALFTQFVKERLLIIRSPYVIRRNGIL